MDMNDTNEIMQHLANAYVTSCNALGHHKSRANEIKVAQYKDQLCKLGIDVPDLSPWSDDDSFKAQLRAIGQFNGEGAV
jgi:hypothetical protein